MIVYLDGFYGNLIGEKAEKGNKKANRKSRMDNLIFIDLYFYKF